MSHNHSPESATRCSDDADDLLQGAGCCSGSCATAAAEPAAPTPRSAVRDTFRVEGLDCAEEIAILRREISPLVGGEAHLAFDTLNGRMMVLNDADTCSEQKIIDAVAATGMRAFLITPGSSTSLEQAGGLRRTQTILTATSGLLVVCGFLLQMFVGELPARVAYALAIATGGRYVAPKGWYALRRLRPDMNLLMVIAVVGAVAIGEWFEAATVTALFALSIALEGWSVGRARNAIASLMSLTPPTVRLLNDDGSEQELAVAEVAVGSRFIVKPGERIPLDGQVSSGHSNVNQAPITGESMPVSKQPDDPVFAGTLNGDGALEIISSKAAGDTIVAQIVRLMNEAQTQRGRSEQWVERFALYYTPLVMLLAIVVALLPPLLGGDWGEWFYRALVLLVIACPCALVISTPVSIVSAIASAARNGALIKGGRYVELPAHLKVVAMDKTGTLTEGKPAVVATAAYSDHDQQQMLQRAAALELRSDHPLAHAIVDYASQQGVNPAAAEQVQSTPGKGVVGQINGHNYWLGSHRLLLERGHEQQQVVEQSEAWEAQGYSVVAVGSDDHVCGLIAIADRLRPESAAAIRGLHQAGIERVVMLTGDNRTTAEQIGREAGIDEIHAELLPADKLALIERLGSEYGPVAMIGDGINDAPAMARADLGIAMGAIGSETAIEAADIALMSDDLSRLPWLIGHGRRTLSIIKQNIAFALAVKLLFALLTFAGLATLWGAIAADTGASLLVVANGLRLLKSDRA